MDGKNAVSGKALKAAAVAARVLEALCAALVLAYAALLVLEAVAPDAPAKTLVEIANENRGELCVNGFRVLAVQGDGIIRGAVVVFAIVGALSFACRTLIFRNVGLLLRNAAAKARGAQGEGTDNGGKPVQGAKDARRLIRKIGIFYILMPLLELLAATVFRIALGAEGLETDVEMLESFVTGLIVLALSLVWA